MHPLMVIEPAHKIVNEKVETYCFIQDIYRFKGNSTILIANYGMDFIKRLFSQGKIMVLNGIIYDASTNRRFIKKEYVNNDEIVIGKPYKFKVGVKK